ncbi:hypothetical protein IKG60_02240 [Candidatus Saccharibacteria bacterium]|nr:hypothetical protein [Candidatus Saccharibacteria bacterium]
MAKSLLIMIFSALMTLVGNSVALMATDTVAVTGIDSSRAVETVPLPEPEPAEPATPAAPVAGSNTVPIMPTIYTQTYEAPVQPAAPVVTNYTVTYNVVSVAEYNALAYNLSYSDIYKFRKLVYGHNSSNLLGSLAHKNVGETITVTEGGVATSYQIVWKQELHKESANNLGGYTMSSIANGLGMYDLAFVTCSGYGDTPYRWVLFANRA